MIIEVEPSGNVALGDQDNFRAFKVVCTAPISECEKALGSVGRLDGDHLWVSPDWLESNGRPDEIWRAGLRKMIEYAASAGWTDDKGTVRAHIEITAL